MPTRPIPFPGTAEEKLRNRHSHRWGDVDGACFRCAAKPWHVAAEYPCGVKVPREEFDWKEVN